MGNHKDKIEIVDRLNPGWATAVGEGGQGEIIPIAEPAAPYVIGELRIVPLADIYPNPFQPRTSEDLAAVTEMAVDIFRRGLKEFPDARAVDGHYELAFGHTRRAAFQLLYELGVPEVGIAPDERYAEMPLTIKEMSDLEMFETAIAENVKRRDLNAMEKAAAMQTYQTRFHATSRQAAELFGVDSATVRGLTRLLDLPEPVRVQIATGQIVQGTARKLLSLAKVIEPEKVTAIATQIADGGNPDQIIQWSMSNDKKFLKMWESWRREEVVRAGVGLWPLKAEVEPGELPQLETKQVVKALAMEATPEIRARVTQYIAILSDPGQQAGMVDQNPDHAELIQKISHLLHPPACLSCAFHLALDSSHLCGLKLCHSRKADAWASAELRTVSERLGIAIYNPATDGKAIIALNDLRGDNWKNRERLVEQKDPQLRLELDPSQYNKHVYTDSYLVAISLVGENAQKVLDAQKAAAADAKNGYVQQNKQRELNRRMRQASEKFFNDCIPGLFAPAFKGLDHLAAACALTKLSVPKDTAKKAATLAKARIELASMALRDRNNLWDIEVKGPVALAKHFKGIAKTWGIELPADFLDIAKSYEPEAVSVETPGE